MKSEKQLGMDRLENLSSICGTFNLGNLQFGTSEGKQSALKIRKNMT